MENRKQKTPKGAVVMRMRTMSNYGDDWMCPNCKFEQGIDPQGIGRSVCLKCGHTEVGGERDAALEKPEYKYE